MFGVGIKKVVCVAGVQRGARGEVELEREARLLGSRRDRASRSKSTSPPPSPLYAGHAG